MRRRFGAMVGGLVMLACLADAPFHDANSSTFSANALALLLAEIGVAIERDRSRVPFLLLGFAQVWFSFDYIWWCWYLWRLSRHCHSSARNTAPACVSRWVAASSPG
jgi:hypothetical protein